MPFESSGASAPIRHFESDPRAMRLASEFRKLAAAARNYMSSRPRLFPLGEDPLVRQLVSSAGLGELDVYIHRTGAGQRTVTALCIPTRVWRDNDSRRRLLEIKQQAKALRTSCILVPQRWLRAPVRSSVARVLAAARNISYSRRQKGDVLGHLKEARISSLYETASAIAEHDDPVGAVLAMACHGLLELDRSKVIGANTYAAAASWMAAVDIEGGKP